MKKQFLITSLFVAVLVTASSLTVKAWNWSRPFGTPSKEIKTLIVTGNYTKQRVLAELVQFETKQPIILLPAVPGGKIFFIPSKNEAMEVEDAKFTDFVKFINPKQILIIGDDGILTQSYVNRINPYQTKVVVQNKNMEEAAGIIGKLLDLTDLADDFSELNKKIDSGQLYKSGSPVVSPDPAMSLPPAPPAAPKTGTTTTAPVVVEPVLIEDTQVVPK